MARSHPRAGEVPDASPVTAVERGLVGASWNFPLNPVIFAGKNICGSVFSGSLDETVHGDFVRLFKKDDLFACFWLCWVFIAGWALLRLR